VYFLQLATYDLKSFRLWLPRCTKKLQKHVVNTGHNRTFGDNRVAGYAASVQPRAMLNMLIDKEIIAANSGLY